MERDAKAFADENRAVVEPHLYAALPGSDSTIEARPG
jgi:hypothetical protein